MWGPKLVLEVAQAKKVQKKELALAQLKMEKQKA
jgi:hypothetical protein